MAVKWIIRELEQVEYPGTQLQYGVFDETGKMVSAHHEKEDAEQMAAFPLMLEALEAAFTYVLNYALYDDDYRANIDLQCPEHEEKLAKQLKAALEAAKAE
jgi:hypothetical protein